MTLILIQVTLPKVGKLTVKILLGTTSLATFRLKIRVFRGSKVTMLHPMGARVTGVD